MGQNPCVYPLSVNHTQCLNVIFCVCDCLYILIYSWNCASTLIRYLKSVNLSQVMRKPRYRSIALVQHDCHK